MAADQAAGASTWAGQPASGAAEKKKATRRAVTAPKTPGHADPPPHAVPHAEPDAAPAVAVEDDAPGLSWDEYLEQRRALEAKRVALEARWTASPRFPRWLYHASLAARIVGSRAERQGLGSGWHVTPV
jgi:hypothetical protein